MGDVVHSVRLIRRYPFSSVAIVVVLALGIGANTAMFASFRAWVTRPLDFAEPERLVAPASTRPRQGERDRPVSARDAFDWRRECRGLEDLALFDRHSSAWMTTPTPSASRVRDRGDALPTPGRRAPARKKFSDDDDLPGEPAPVALISDALWRRSFGADPA